ncbi:MAG: 1-acyl-sn-glycerol-3-phosphate acyltransferase [Treponema sp.]|nr:1-acyl-sn-glycerol-3-phosphate acyltransferase [Treponema sp.]
MKSLARTIGVFTVVIVTVVIVSSAGAVLFLFSLIGFKKSMSFAMYKVAQMWAKLLIAVTGCRLTVKGREHIPDRGGVCFVSNHGSIFDILLILAYAGRPFGFMAKKELIWLPLINMWIALLGGFFLDRKNLRKALGTINKGVQNIQKGGAMIIFPEGRRSRGQGLLPFKAGAFKLATQSNAVIVPVAIAGSYDIFEKMGRIQTVSVGLVFASPIAVADIPREDRKQHLADRVHAVIADALPRDFSQRAP